MAQVQEERGARRGWGGLPEAAMAELRPAMRAGQAGKDLGRPRGRCRLRVVLRSLDGGPVMRDEEGGGRSLRARQELGCS